MLNNIISYSNPFSKGHITARATFFELPREYQGCSIAATGISILLGSYFFLPAGLILGTIVFKLAVELSAQTRQINKIGLSTLINEKKEKKDNYLSDLIKEVEESKTIETLSRCLPLINKHLVKNPSDENDWKTFWESLTKSDSSKVCTIVLEGNKKIKIPQTVLGLQSQTYLSILEDTGPKDDIEMPIHEFFEINQATVEDFVECLKKGFIGQEINMTKAMDFLSLANYFNINWIMNVCRTFIFENLNENNIVEIYNFFRKQEFSNDLWTPLFREKLVEHFNNPKYLKEFIDQFHDDNKIQLEATLAENPSKKIELLCLLLPKIINGPEKSLISLACLESQDLSKILMDRPKLFIVFKMICPSFDFMTVDERCKLIDALIFKPQQLDDQELLTQIFEFFNKNQSNEKLIYQYRKDFSSKIKNPN